MIDRDAPGFAEAMRAESLQSHADGDPHPGRLGDRRADLIINFPGNPKAIGELFRVIAPALAAVATLQRDAAARPALATTGRPRPLSCAA